MNRQFLTQWGWKPFFQQQLDLDEWEQCLPARVLKYERSLFSVLTKAGNVTLPITASTPSITVGDWILLDRGRRFHRLLDRASLFSRRAAGPGVEAQLIAANIDTVFIVSSLNQDFNLNRVERYLTLAHQVGVEPVIVLSKADLCDNEAEFVARAQGLDSRTVVVAVNGLCRDSVAQLAPWCGPGSTVALLGSSGVGKSTLVNTLLTQDVQTTAAIREDDAKGRHTTSGRSLHLLPNGGLLLDTPGMRELQLVDCEEGLEGAFADIAELARRCKFADCRHQVEPGCAVRAALENGELEERRLSNYHKLLREQALHSATLAEKRARERKLGKVYRSVQHAHRIKRGDE